MREKLRILILEDVPSDAELMEHSLRREGIAFTSKVVGTEEAYLMELKSFSPDIILSDYSLPNFDGMSALKYKYDIAPLIPFIIVTGSINEETAVECIKTGADDYVTKDHMMRLGSAVKAALESKRIKEERVRAEEALRDSEERYRNLIETSPDAIVVADLETKIIMVNQQALNLFGFEKEEEVIGISGLDMVAPEDRENATKDMARTLSEQSVRDIEYNFLKKDGSSFPADLRISTITDANGKQWAFLTVIRDITERKHAEERIKHLNLVLRAIRNVNQLITVEKDRNKLIKGVCETLIQTRGYYNAWIAVFDKSGRLDTAAEAGLGNDFRPIIEMLEQGKLNHCCRQTLMESRLWTTQDPPSTCGDCPLAHKYSGRGGMSISLEHDGNIYGLLTVSVSTEIALDKEEPALFREVAGDIAFALYSIEIEEERSQAEKALRESEKKYRLLAENVNDVIWIMDMNLNQTYISPSIEQLVGFTVEERMKQTPEEMATPDSLKTAMNIFGEEMEWEKSGEADPFRYRLFDLEIKHKDGSTIWAEYKMSFLRDQTGQPIGLLGVTRDITERKRAEKELRIKDSAIASSINAISIAGLDLNLTYVNDSFLKMWGYEDEQEVLGKSAVEFWQAERTASAIGDILRDIGSWAGERVAVRKDGSTFDVLLSASLVTDNAGEPVCIMASFSDISERKRAEEALRESEQQLSYAMSAANDGLWDWNAKTGVVRHNERLIRMRGYEPEELPWSFEVWQSQVHPDDLPGALESLQAHLDGKTPDYVVEFRTRLKNGQWIWIGTRGKAVEREADGSPIRVVGTDTDITERRRVEEALRKSEIKYKTLIDNFKGIIFTIDLEGNVTFASHGTEEVLGYKSEETINMNIIDFVPAEEKQRAMETIPQGMTGEKIIQYQTPAIMKSGDSLFLEITFSRIFEDGSVVGAQAIAIDITERKRAEDALRLKNLVFDASISANSIADASGIITEVNQAFLDLWGYSDKGEIIGTAISDFFQNKEEAEEVVGTLNRSDVWEGIFIAKRNEDSTFIAHGLASVLRDENGKMIGYQSSVIDITDRKRAEELLEKEKNKLEAIISEVSVGVVVYDESGQCVLANDAIVGQIGAKTIEDVLAQNYHDIESWKKSGLLDKAEKAMNENSIQREPEIWMKSTFGQDVIMDYFFRPILIGQNKHLLVTAYNIKERKQLEAQLNQAMKMEAVGRLAGGGRTRL